MASTRWYQRLAATPLFLSLAVSLQAATAGPGEGCRHRDPQWLFCADFEGGNLARWDHDPPRKKGTLTLVADTAAGGESPNTVLQLRVNPGRGGVGLNKTFTPAQYDRLYARWYQKYEPGFDFTAPNHGHGFHAGDRWKRGVSGRRPYGNDYFTAQLEYKPAKGDKPARPYIYAYYRGMYMDCRDPNGRCWGDSFPCMLAPRYCKKNPQHQPTTPPPALQADRWYCMELMVDAGDPVDARALANGSMNFWVDGVAYGPWQQLWFRTDASVQLNHFWLGLFHHGRHAVQGILYDDVVVSRSRVGCH